MCKEVAAINDGANVENFSAQSCQLFLILKAILVHNRACAPKFEEQTRAHVLCALQAPMQVETNLRDKACNLVKRPMCSRAAPCNVGNMLMSRRMCWRVNKQTGS